MTKYIGIKRLWSWIMENIWLILRLAAILILIGLIGVVLLMIYFTKDLPQPEIFNEIQTTQSTEIYDRTGKVLLYKLGPEDRELITLDQVPQHLKNAILATEDSHFYEHPGVDINGLVRVVICFGQCGGGSTLTQQLIRTTFLSTEKSIGRKIKEITLSLQLERRYSKDQIFEWYLNRVPYSGNIYGVQQAAKVYFGKPAKDLSINESALLAALIQRPSYFSPFGSHVDELIKRKNDYVLKRMLDEKFISKEEYEKYIKEPVGFIKNKDSILAPHFSLYVKQLLINEYGEDFINENGLKVYTTLNWDLQKEVERIIKEKGTYNEKFNAYNAAAVVVDPNTGEILSMVGSKDYWGQTAPQNCTSNCLFDPQVNMTVYGNGRQPGSTFKPFIYVTAFKKGYNDKTIIVDEPTNFGNWGGKDYTPTNYDGLFRGAVTIRSALAMSLNIPAVKTLMYLAGLQDSVKTAQDMGINTLKPPYGPSIVLGGWEVKPLEITSAFGVFATEGMKVDPHPILRVENTSGEVIKKYSLTPKRVLSEKDARLINNILSDNVARSPMFGPRSNLYFDNYAVAAKTGTTNDFKDGWTIGYTPKTAVGVWVGNNNNAAIKKLGETMAGPAFHQIMQYCLYLYPPEKEFTKP